MRSCSTSAGPSTASGDAHGTLPSTGAVAIKFCRGGDLEPLYLPKDGTYSGAPVDKPGPRTTHARHVAVAALDEQERRTPGRWATRSAHARALGAGVGRSVVSAIAWRAMREWAAAWRCCCL